MAESREWPPRSLNGIEAANERASVVRTLLRRSLSCASLRPV